MEVNNNFILRLLCAIVPFCTLNSIVTLQYDIQSNFFGIKCPRRQMSYASNVLGVKSQGGQSVTFQSMCIFSSRYIIFLITHKHDKKGKLTNINCLGCQMSKASKVLCVKCPRFQMSWASNV